MHHSAGKDCHALSFERTLQVKESVHSCEPVNRLDETVSTDPIFANCANIDDRFRGAQIFHGCKSHHIDAFGIKHKSDFPAVCKDFLRDQGAPGTLRRDNARKKTVLQ